MKRKSLMKISKKTVVELYHSGTPVKELCSEYGISEVAVYKWIKTYSPIGAGEDALTPKGMAAIALQKENLRLKQSLKS